MSKSVKAKVHNLLAMESYVLREQKIHKIRAVMEALAYGAEKVSSTKCRQFQVRLNRARQAATTWSDGDRQKATDSLQRQIHQETLPKRRLFDELFHHYERQLLQEVGTKAIGPRSIFDKQLALMKTAAEDKAYGAANMTPDKWLRFPNRLSDVETEATTRNLADLQYVRIQLKREIYGITSNEQKRFKKEFSISMIKFNAWYEATGIQALRKTIQQRVIRFGYPTMHLVRHISDWIRRMGAGDNFTNDIFEQLHITNLKEAYRSSNKVNCIRQMLKHNDRCTGLDYMKETLAYLALQGWYDVHSAKVFNLLSATVKWRSIPSGHLLHLQTIHDELCICPVSQHV